MSINNNVIQCPHCDYEHEEYWEYIETADMEGEFKMDCEGCDREFYVNFHTDVWFHTSRVKIEEGE